MNLKIPLFDNPISDEYKNNILKNEAQEYIDFFNWLPEALQLVIRRILIVDSVLFWEKLEHWESWLFAIKRSHIFSQAIIWTCNNFKIDWPEKNEHFQKYYHLIKDSYSAPNKDSVKIEWIWWRNRFHLKEKSDNSWDGWLENIYMRISWTLTAPWLESLTEDWFPMQWNQKIVEKNARKILKEYWIHPFPE